MCSVCDMTYCLACVLGVVVIVCASCVVLDLYMFTLIYGA
jgi:hypothetical protein